MLTVFFLIHYFIVKVFKYKIDFKNIVLKNYNFSENNRTVLNTIKSIFRLDLQICYRFDKYFYYLR